MKIDIWMPFFVSDYLGDTMELTTEEHGIYLLLLLQYWKKGQLTNNIKKLQIVTKTDDKNIDSLNSILSEFFTLKQDKYINNRIEIELKKANSRRESASINGKKGGRPPKKNNPQETHSFIGGKPTGNPTPNPQESSSSSSSSSPISTQSKSTEDKEGDKSPSRKKFVKPTIFDLERYCKEKSYTVDCEAFILHYESNGWLVGKNKMKSWQSALGTWNRNSFGGNSKTTESKWKGEQNFELTITE